MSSDQATPAVPIPAKVMENGPAAVDAYVKKAGEKRKNLLSILEPVRIVRLNTSRRIVFDITETQTGGKVILSLCANGIRVARFGQNGVPELSKMPLHGLLAIFHALKGGDLVNISNGDRKIEDPSSNRPAIEKESPDPVDKLARPALNQLLLHLNHMDGKKDTPGNGNSLENILKFAKSRTPEEIQSMIHLERENRQRRPVLLALEQMLYKLENEEQEKKILAGT